MATRRARRRPLRDLDAGIRRVLDDLLRDDRHTITEITEHLRQLGAQVSRSAVGRYAQEHERIAADIRAARMMAETVGQELVDVKGDAGRLVIESLQALLLRARMQLADGEDISAEDLGRLARAAKDLQQALRANIEASIRVREQALRDAAQAATQAATEAGISGELVDAIKTRILGVRDT